MIVKMVNLTYKGRPPSPSLRLRPGSLGNFRGGDGTLPAEREPAPILAVFYAPTGISALL